MKFFNKFVVSMIYFIFLFCPGPLFAAIYDFGVVADGGLWNSDSQSVHDSLLRYSVKKLVMPGDNLYSPLFNTATYEEMWTPWRESGFMFDVVAIGNHNGGYAQEIQYFNMPSEAYSVEYDNLVTFIVLNSDNEDSSLSQAQFLESVLSANTDPYIFLVYHHPSYTLTEFHPAFEKYRFQHAIRPILFKYRNKITSLLLGHDHLSIVAHFNDLPAIVSGSTHEQRPIIPMNYQEGFVTVKTNWFNNSAPLWARLRIDSTATFAQLDFVNSRDDNIVCTLYLVSGNEASLQSNCY